MPNYMGLKIKLNLLLEIFFKLRPESRQMSYFWHHHGEVLVIKSLNILIWKPWFPWTVSKYFKWRQKLLKTLPIMYLKIQICLNYRLWQWTMENLKLAKFQSEDPFHKSRMLKWLLPIMEIYQILSYKKIWWWLKPYCHHLTEMLKNFKHFTFFGEYTHTLSNSLLIQLANFQIAPRIKADVVFLAPPWGVPGYKRSQYFDLETMIPMNGIKVFQAASKITKNISYYVPKNTNVSQLSSLAADDGKVEISQISVRGPVSQKPYVIVIDYCLLWRSVRL